MANDYDDRDFKIPGETFFSNIVVGTKSGFFSEAWATPVPEVASEVPLVSSNILSCRRSRMEKQYTILAS